MDMNTIQRRVVFPMAGMQKDKYHPSVWVTSPTAIGPMALRWVRLPFFLPKKGLPEQNHDPLLLDISAPIH